MFRRLPIIALLLCITSGVSAQNFSEQTVAAGISFTSDVLEDIPSPGHYAGGTVGDFNRDGVPDVFVVGGGGVADALFINNGDGTFTDRAVEWGVALLHRGRAASAADFNGDGWTDIFIASGGDLSGPDRPGEHILYKNGGDGSFTDVATSAGVNFSTTLRSSMSSAWGDYDLDGDLDLMLMTWHSSGASNRLFRNNGDETFTDVTTLIGIISGWGFTPRFVDMNGDRYPELLLVSDFGDAEYYVNDGLGAFTDQTAAAGTGLESNGMGTAVGDFNRDGWQDWFCTSIFRDNLSVDGNYLYMNDGDGTFTPLPHSAGVQDGGWGWGTETLDFDHDGFIDIAETNGRFFLEYVNESSYLYRNNGDLTFTRSELPKMSEGRALMTLDYDLDGDMDILITMWSAPLQLWRNDLSGPGTNWIQILLDTDADADLAPHGVGTRIQARTGSITQTFYMSRGGTYLGQSQRIAHFGLGSATSIDELSLEWTDGTTTLLTDLPVNQTLTLTPSVVGVPGEASAPGDPADQLQVGIDRTSGKLTVDYAPACGAVNHTLYYGDLAALPASGYAGAVCGRGSSGSTSFDLPSSDAAFFVMVGNSGSVEGPYGVDSEGDPRLEDIATAGCDLTQNLTPTCN